MDKSSPLNSNTPTSLKIIIAKPCNGRLGIFNQGFKALVAKGKFQETSVEWRQKVAEALRQPGNGLAVAAKKKYDFSVYARAQEFFSKLTVMLETQSGQVLALKQIKGVSKDWKKFALTLSPKNSDDDAPLTHQRSTS